METDVISAFKRCAEEYDEWYRKGQGLLIFEPEVKAMETLALEGLGVEVGTGTGVFASRLSVFLGVEI